jgi:rhamnulokinase
VSRRRSSGDVSVTLHAAADLGATSGRVVLGKVDPNRLELKEIHRFPNGPVELAGSLHWDVVGLYREVLTGLEALPKGVATLGIDSWAIDYGLLDERGALLGIPYSYRDRRTEDVVDKVHAELSHEELYRLHGLQFLPFTTLYQLAAARGTAALGPARQLLLVPDLIGYWLTGQRGVEITNASTTGLFDATTRTWSPVLSEVAGIDPAILPPLRRPGDSLGRLSDGPYAQTRFKGEVLAVGSHDTASAVVAVPMKADAAYISLGTWGLVGVEIDRPVLSAESCAANFTNELGVDGRVRYLRNVAGLFLLSEALHHWRFTAVDRDRLLETAAEVPRGPVFDVDDPRLATPGNMPAKILDVLADSGMPPLRRKVQIVRSILDSLAVKLAATVHEAAALSGKDVKVVNLVGGGVNNPLLCQLLADEVGLPVEAGPVEATALGNLLVQARAHGTLSGSLEDLRELVRRTQRVVTYQPRTS